MNIFQKALRYSWDKVAEQYLEVFRKIKEKSNFYKDSIISMIMGEQTLLPMGLKEFDEDSRWFYENIDLLRKRNLTGKFVAIKNKTVISSGKSIEEVIKSIEEIGENPAYVLIEFIYPEGTVILL